MVEASALILQSEHPERVTQEVALVTFVTSNQSALKVQFNQVDHRVTPSALE